MSELINLRAVDVWRQYQHSLEDCTTDIGFALQFPLSISPCLRRFSILQNIYELHAGSANSPKKIEVSSLPLGLDKTLSHYWTKRTRRPSSPCENFHSWRTSEPLFEYFLTFNPDGNSIFFLAKESSSLMLYMAVFKMASEANSCFSLASPYRIYCKPKGSHMEHLVGEKQAVHPSYDIVAFTDRGHVFIWYYGWGIDTSEAGSHILKEHMLDSGEPEAAFWSSRNIYYQAEGYEKITFSEDGKYLVTETTTSSQPLVIPLPKVALKNTVAPPSENIEDSLLSTTVPLPGHEMSILSVNASTHVIASDSAVAGITISTSSGALKVNLFSQSRESRSSAELEVVRLPDSWGKANFVDASMHLIKSNDAKLRAILSQAPKPYYDMSNSASKNTMTHLPAVIDSGVQRIRVVRTENIEGADPRKLLMAGYSESTIGERRRIEENDSGRGASKRVRREEQT